MEKEKRKKEDFNQQNSRTFEAWGVWQRKEKIDVVGRGSS